MAEAKKPQVMGRGGGPGSRFTALKEKPKNRRATLKRLMKYIASSKILFIMLILVVIFYTIFNLLTNLYVKDVATYLGTFDIEKMIFTLVPDEHKFYKALMILLGLYLGYAILQYFASLLGAYLATKTVRKMRNDLFKKIVYLPISYIDSHPHGDLLSRMTNDVDNISNAITSSITSLVSGILMIIGCLGIMIWYSPLLTLVSLVVLALTLLLTKFMSKHIRPLFLSQQEVLGSLNSQTEEMITNYKSVVTNNREEIAIEKFNQYSNSLTRVGAKAQMISGSMGPCMNFIGNVGYFLVCILGSIFVVNNLGGSLTGNALTIPVVIMFLTTTKQFTRPINEIAQLYSSLLTALAGAERVFTILDEESESFDGEIEFDYKSIKGEIDFKDIKFGYNDKIVLNNFNMHANPGNKIALVGATGSGKTTIVNLLLRFYDTNSGMITIDGKDIAKVSKHDLRKAISIVLQEPVLFGDTIENNIRYGKDGATDEEVDKALAFANCDHFVSQLENGKKTVLNEGATNISQGQRQLLTIARAVIADPKILILDEATSSVDTRTEKRIQDAMVKLMANRSSIIIAHRLSTIQDADLIIVLDHGEVVESGNHNELLKHNGVYKKLYDTQFKGLNT